MLGKRGHADLEANGHMAPPPQRQHPQPQQQPQHYAVKRFATVVDPVSGSAPHQAFVMKWQWGLQNMACAGMHAMLCQHQLHSDMHTSMSRARQFLTSPTPSEP